MKNQIPFPNCVMMLRDEFTTVGTLNYHTFLHLDTICEAAQIPKIDVLIVDELSDPFISRGFSKKFPGFYLHLPAYLTTFLSYNELQILIHWCFLQATETLGNPFTSLLNYYPQDRAAAMLIKIEALKSSWIQFQRSVPYRDTKDKNPLLICLETHGLKEFLDTVTSELESNREIFRLIKSFDDTTLKNFLLSCAVMEYNQVFNLKNIDYYNFSNEIFKELRSAS